MYKHTYKQNLAASVKVTASLTRLINIDIKLKFNDNHFFLGSVKASSYKLKQVFLSFLLERFKLFRFLFTPNITKSARNKFNETN